MIPNINKTIWSEYNNEQRKCNLKAKTDSEGLSLALYLTTVNDQGKDQQIVTMTDREFKRLANALGYKRTKFNSMDEILSDPELNLITD